MRYRCFFLNKIKLPLEVWRSLNYKTQVIALFAIWLSLILGVFYCFSTLLLHTNMFEVYINIYVYVYFFHIFLFFALTRVYCRCVLKSNSEHQVDKTFEVHLNLCQLHDRLLLQLNWLFCHFCEFFRFLREKETRNKYRKIKSSKEK